MAFMVFYVIIISDGTITQNKIKHRFDISELEKQYSWPIMTDIKTSNPSFTFFSARAVQQNTHQIFASNNVFLNSVHVAILS